jgi:NAD(P)-dependent dehydrogenase (short-subunit alcohol dehydrogenase family)
MRLKDKVAVVTGGGRGIGRAIAEACAREGARVAVTARTESQLRETADLIRDQGGNVEAIVSDVTDDRAVLAAFRRVLERWGTVDLLVNNAGSFSAVGPVWESDPTAWFHDIRTNLLGSHLWCRAVIPHMLRKNGGRIVNLIGGGTFGPFEYGSGYGASKAAIMRYTETLALELAHTGVSVFAVDPGLVKTRMAESLVSDDKRRRWFGWVKINLEQGKVAPPTEAAAMIVELASGRLDRLSGRAIYHDDDAAQLERGIPDILARDLRTLRMTR